MPRYHPVSQRAGRSRNVVVGIEAPARRHRFRRIADQDDGQKADREHADARGEVNRQHDPACRAARHQRDHGRCKRAGAAGWRRASACRTASAMAASSAGRHQLHDRQPAAEHPDPKTAEDQRPRSHRVSTATTATLRPPGSRRATGPASASFTPLIVSDRVRDPRRECARDQQQPKPIVASTPVTGAHTVSATPTSLADDGDVVGMVEQAIRARGHERRVAAARGRETSSAVRAT